MRRPAGSAEPFRIPVRVYYQDTDAGGVVFHAQYLAFMERARTEWLRAFGFEHTALSRDFEVVFVVRATAIDYLRPARFNDELEVTVQLRGARGSLIEIVQTLRQGAQLLVTAEVRLACVNTRSFRPVRIPAPILQAIVTRKA